MIGDDRKSCQSLDIKKMQSVPSGRKTSFRKFPVVFHFNFIRFLLRFLPVILPCFRRIASAPIPFGGFSDPSLLLLLLVLKEPPPFAFLNDSCPKDLGTEATDKRILGLVVLHHHLHIVTRCK